MSQQSCTACNDLREYAPEFVVNGVTDDVCSHLANNEGLSGADDHTNCDDLHDVNDCLIGNMDDEVEGFEVCDWKDFMHQYIPNNYETLKAMICSMCGLWCSLTKLVDALQNAASFTPTQKFLRSSDAHTSAYWEASNVTETISLNDANSSTNQGTFYAPNDGVAIVTFCFALRTNNDNDKVGFHIFGYNSNETPDDAMRIKRSVHTTTHEREGAKNFSTAVKMPKGTYLNLRCIPSYSMPDGNPSSADVRLHQICITFIPTFELSIDPIGDC